MFNNLPTFRIHKESQLVEAIFNNKVVGFYMFFLEPIKFQGHTYHYYYEFFPTGELGFLPLDYVPSQAILNHWMIHSTQNIST